MIKIFDFYVFEGIILDTDAFFKNPIVTSNKNWKPYGKVIKIDCDKEEIEIDLDEDNEMTEKLIKYQDYITFYPVCRSAMGQDANKVIAICHMVNKTPQKK